MRDKKLAFTFFAFRIITQGNANTEGRLWRMNAAILATLSKRRKRNCENVQRRRHRSNVLLESGSRSTELPEWSSGKRRDHGESQAVADANFDGNRLHQICDARRNLQLVTPRRYGLGKAVRHPGVKSRPDAVDCVVGAPTTYVLRRASRATRRNRTSVRKSD